MVAALFHCHHCTRRLNGLIIVTLVVVAFDNLHSTEMKSMLLLALE